MPASRLFEKAEKLLRSGRVEPLGQGVYNVIGNHGTYTVVQNYDGKISCNCPGFLKRRRCSHSTAVLIRKMYKTRRKGNSKANI